MAVEERCKRDDLPRDREPDRETLEAKLKEGAKQEPVDIRLSDFDGASYRIYVDPETTQFVSVSIGMRCYGELFDAGAQICSIQSTQALSRMEWRTAMI